MYGPAHARVYVVAINNILCEMLMHARLIKTDAINIVISRSFWQICMRISASYSFFVDIFYSF